MEHPLVKSQYLGFLSYTIYFTIVRVCTIFVMDFFWRESTVFNLMTGSGISVLWNIMKLKERLKRIPFNVKVTNTVDSRYLDLAYLE